MRNLVRSVILALCERHPGKKVCLFKSPIIFRYEKEKGNCAFVYFIQRARVEERNSSITPTFPSNQIEEIARCIMPDILAFTESEEGQRELAEWKAQQEVKHKQTGTSLEAMRPSFLLYGGCFFFLSPLGLEAGPITEVCTLITVKENQ